MEALEKLKYPVGKPLFLDQYTDGQLEKGKADIGQFPQLITDLVSDLKDAELSWIYRPDGWAIKQVVHHCADSHANALIRFKLALTEDNPTIKPYMEDRWARLPDSLESDLSDSLQWLHFLHRKWIKVLNFMSGDDFDRTFNHPETGRVYRLSDALALYSWHCRHHAAHVKQAIKYKGDFS